MLDSLALAPGDTVTMTLIDRLARSTPDLLSTFAAIANRKAGSRSLGDTWAETAARGRLMLTVLGGPRGGRTRSNPRPQQRRTRPGQGKRAEPWPASRSSPRISDEGEPMRLQCQPELAFPVNVVIRR
jgi:hypothetical protein